MKLKLTFLLLLLCFFANGYSQSFTGYIGVRARYTDSRLVDDAPNPPKRENRLILSFYDVTPSGQYYPKTLTNYDLWVQTSGRSMYNFTDSTGTNYPGYPYTAPIVASYYSSMGLNYIDCNPNAATHYMVNGHELDCGYVTVSYWDVDLGTMRPYEAFPTPLVNLPFYFWASPYSFAPGNLNFGGWTILPIVYNYSCGGNLQYAGMGPMPHDSATAFIPLPVNFANVRGEISSADIATISWTNMTESDIVRYEVERSSDGINFSTIGTQLPRSNNSGREDYQFSLSQPEEKNYYRIKAVESNGTILHSSIIPLSKLLKVSVLTIYPNPVTNGPATARITHAASGRYVLSVISSSNQYVRQKLINHTTGDLLYQFDLTGLPKGIYQLVLQSSTQRYTQKLIYIF